MNGISQLRCQDYGNGPKKNSKDRGDMAFQERRITTQLGHKCKQMIVQTERIQNTDMAHFNKLIRFLNKLKTKITL